MEIEKAITRGWRQHNQAYLRAQSKGQIFFEIKPRRRYAELCYDTLASDPMVCDRLTEEGAEKIKEIYDLYCKSLIGKQKRKRVWVGFGQVSGFFTVAKEDMDQVADQMIAVLSDESYHKTMKD